MNAYSGKDDLAFAPANLSLPTVRFNAPSPMGRVKSAFRRLVELPQRRAVLNELLTMSDRELADIGLTRGEVGHVFDAGRASLRGAI